MRIFSNRWVQTGLAVAVIVGAINFFDRAVTVVEPTSGGNAEQTETSGTATPRRDPVRAARAICRWIDGSGVTSQPCEYSAWNSTITATVDMSASEARKTCDLLSSTLREEDLAPGEGWTLHIRSPYSGDNSIAFCSI